jgi:hypothetical protein
MGLRAAGIFVAECTFVDNAKMYLKDIQRVVYEKFVSVIIIALRAACIASRRDVLLTYSQSSSY